MEYPVKVRVCLDSRRAWTDRDETLFRPVRQALADLAEEEAKASARTAKRCFGIGMAIGFAFIHFITVFLDQQIGHNLVASVLVGFLAGLLLYTWMWSGVQHRVYEKAKPQVSNILPEGCAFWEAVSEREFAAYNALRILFPDDARFQL